MSWLRIDDGFARHPKVTALTLKSRWIWLDLLCYSARYETDGYLPENIAELVPGCDQKYIARALELELLDDTDKGLRVHDWLTYAPKDKTGAERQAKWRHKQRNAAVTEPVTDDVTEEPVTKSSTSHAGARAVPVPSPTTDSQSVNPLLDQTENGDRLTDRNQLGRTAEEQARIDAIDGWWKDEPATGVLERDPYSEPFNDLSPLGEQLAAAKAREEQER